MKQPLRNRRYCQAVVGQKEVSHGWALRPCGKQAEIEDGGLWLCHGHATERLYRVR